MRGAVKTLLMDLCALEDGRFWSNITRACRQKRRLRSQLFCLLSSLHKFTTRVSQCINYYKEKRETGLAWLFEDHVGIEHKCKEGGRCTVSLSVLRISDCRQGCVIQCL